MDLKLFRQQNRRENRRNMVFCNNCKQEVEVDVDEANGFS